MTPQQHNVRDFIKRYTEDHNLAPSYREIATQFDMDVSRVHRILHQLAELGEIRIIPNKRRNIRLVDQAYTVKLHPEVDEALTKYAALEKQRPEAIIREAVRVYLGVAA